jgi:hypothetical protein
MDMNQDVGFPSPNVYTLPNRTGLIDRIGYLLLVVFCISSCAGLYAYFYRYPDISSSDARYTILLFVLFLNSLAFYMLKDRWWIWKYQDYSVSVGNNGLLVAGFHPLSGRLISWQEIDKIKFSYYPAGIHITTFGGVDNLKIPCELNRYPQLISIMAQCIEVNQPNRVYPELFSARYRYVKFGLILFFTVLTTTIIYVTQDLVYMLFYLIIGIYELIEAFLIQKITIFQDGLTLHKLWFSTHYPFSKIKQLQPQEGGTNYEVDHYIGVTLTDRKKPVWLFLIGFDHTLIYLALHQAWKRAITSKNQPNCNASGF